MTTTTTTTTTTKGISPMLKYRKHKYDKLRLCPLFPVGTCELLVTFDSTCWYKYLSAEALNLLLINIIFENLFWLIASLIYTGYEHFVQQVVLLIFFHPQYDGCQFISLFDWKREEVTLGHIKLKLMILQWRVQPMFLIEVASSETVCETTATLICALVV